MSGTPALYSPESMRAEKRTAAGNSVFAAVVITGLKIAVGVSTGSLGILSEAAHSGLDLIAALITFFPMLVNSFVGLRSADLQEVAFLETLGASGREIFRHLRVPSALPYLFSGARISLNLALIGAVIGEWTGADRGLGRVIFVANANLDLTILFGAVLVLAAIGIAANAFVGVAERRLLHWHPIAVAT